MNSTAYKFVKESNIIEGIYREPNMSEMDEYARFMRLDHVSIEDIECFVKIYEPTARLRTELGDDVRVGSHIPIPGGSKIRVELQKILDQAKRIYTYAHDSSMAWELHRKYENLHPFNDCNGRSGRMLWAWQMNLFNTLSFLHRFYYQTLQYGGKA